MIETDKILMLISSTLIISYVSELFYKRTKIPDMIWVLGFGILLGPVLGYFDKELFLYVSPLMSAVALCVILFDAGINLDITMVVNTITKSVGLQIATFISTVLSVGLLLNYLMPESFTLLQGLLFGAMIGGTSTIAVFGILGGLEKLIPDIESTRVILLMESVISDPVCIITSITIIRMIMLPEVSILHGFMDIILTFILSSAFGFSIGILWAETLNRLRGRRFNYMVTMAVLFPTYIMAENVIGEGGGPMAALAFGLMITNHGYVFGRLGLKRGLKIDKRRLREFYGEIAFFIKAFFFVYIGLIVTISMQYLKLGLVVVAVSLFVRFVVATGVGRILKFTRTETVLTQLIFASGLPAFVMSQLPFIYDPERLYFLNPEIYPSLCMPIVLGTVLFGAIAGPLIAKKRLTQMKG